MSGKFIACLAAAGLVASCAPGMAAPPAAPKFTPTPAQTEWTEICSDWDDWDKPALPFRIFGNSWYVGTCGISAILITGDEGHILIDGGTAAGAEVIASNIKALGFKLSDVKLLLMSHEHFDHVGGLAKLQRLTGARLIASPAAAPVLTTGVASAEDPQAGIHEPFPPARVDEVLDGAMTVTLGDLKLTAIATPGHTPGALSWHWRSCDGSECKAVAYADSLTPVSSDSYRFSDHPDYLASYKASLESLAKLDCDILLAPHPSAAGMRDKLLGKIPFVDPESCKAYAKGLTERLDARLAKEAGK